MSKFNDIRNGVGTRSKSLLVAVADIVESMTTQNLAIATDVAGFAVSQLRLPTQVNDFSDYRDRNRDAYTKFGVTLKGHGVKLIDVARDVPGQIRDALTVETPVVVEVAEKVKVATKATTKKTAAKKAPARKAASKKAKAAA